MAKEDVKTIVKRAVNEMKQMGKNSCSDVAHDCERIDEIVHELMLKMGWKSLAKEYVRVKEDMGK